MEWKFSVEPCLPLKTPAPSTRSPTIQSAPIAKPAQISTQVRMPGTRRRLKPLHLYPREYLQTYLPLCPNHLPYTLHKLGNRQSHLPPLVIPEQLFLTSLLSQHLKFFRFCASFSKFAFFCARDLAGLSERADFLVALTFAPSTGASLSLLCSGVCFI